MCKLYEKNTKLHLYKESGNNTKYVQYVNVLLCICIIFPPSYKISKTELYDVSLTRANLLNKQATV